MKVLVVGAGAVGGYFGAMLARGGHDVTFVARGEHGRAIRERGIAIDTPEGRLDARVPVLADVRDAAGRNVDVAIVAVKASSLGDVAPGVGASLGEHGVAVPLLNGLDSEEELAAVIGKERVIGGIAQISSRIAEPGRIHVDGAGRIVLAPLLPGQMPLVSRIAEAFSEAGFDCDAKTDLSRVLWTKLLWNAPFNAVSALTDRNVGDVLDVPELEELVRAAMREVALVARADGVVIDDAMIDKTLAGTRASFRGSEPSMLQDVRAGRTTETQALQGAVVRRGARHGIATPIHATLLALMLGRERPSTN